MVLGGPAHYWRALDGATASRPEPNQHERIRASMSAFEVDNTHIDVMVSAALQRIHGDRLRWYFGNAETEPGQALIPWDQIRDGMREVTPENAETWGATLLAENRRSVNHRYDESEIEAPYTFTEYAGHFDPVKMLAAIGCYEYQACEHPGWKTSEAQAFCEALRSRMIHQLPGYGNFHGHITDAGQVTIGGAMRVAKRGQRPGPGMVVNLTDLL